MPLGRGEESIAGRVDLAPAIALQFATDQSVMALKEVPPIAIAQSRHKLRRSGDICAQNSRQNTTAGVRMASAGDELLNLSEYVLSVPNPGYVVGSRKQLQSRARNLSRDVSRLIDLDIAILDSVHDESRDANQGQNRSNVRLAVIRETATAAAGLAAARR